MNVKIEDEKIKKVPKTKEIIITFMLMNTD